MKKYYLQVIMSISYVTKPFIVEANSVEIAEGCFIFRDVNTNLLAAYPVNRTILEKIENK